MKSCTKYDLDLWPWPWKVHPRSKILKLQLRKTSQNMLGYYAQGIICCWHQRSRSRLSKGQIHLIGYNFTSVTETSNLVHILVYEKSYQIRPWPWKVHRSKFLKHQLRKLAKTCLDIMHRAYSIVGEVKGQGQAKGQSHLIGYNFTSNCHRDFKLGSYFCFWIAAPNMTFTLNFDLDLEKFTQGQIFWNISFKEN